jgi:hypothetical protein
MVHIIQNHWICGLHPSSRILNLMQSLRLAHSKGPKRVGVSFPSPEDGNRSSFQNNEFTSHLEFLTLDNAHKASDSDTLSLI